MPAQSFPTTRWSLIRSSFVNGKTQAQDALAELCRIYWYPVYSFIRARTASAEDAQDLTQEFFLHFLGGAILQSANPMAGRFRSFLAGSLKNFLADQTDRRNAQKRGGGLTALPLDLAEAEERFARDLQHHETPERIFERQWAVTVVSEACKQLHESLAREGREELFLRLQEFLPGGAERSFASAAADLGMSEGAVKVAVHRLRRRYREVLRANVSYTVADPQDVDREIRFLLDALSARNGS
jgi:RNA polymerase sigma-70 factor (ECF subfamily)